MRRNSLLAVFVMTLAVLAGANADSRGQTQPAAKKEEAPLRVALAGLAHGHAFGFFDQFQKRTDLWESPKAIISSRHNSRRAMAWHRVCSIPIWRKC